MNQGLKLKFKWGQSDYRLGSHPAWQLFRCVYQMRNQPYIVGGLATLAGYYLALLARRPRSVSADFVEFRGKEQMQRLKSFFIGRPSTTSADLPLASRMTARSGSGAAAQVGEDTNR
jgi:hypothetical protein